MTSTYGRISSILGVLRSWMVYPYPAMLVLRSVIPLVIASSSFKAWKNSDLQALAYKKRIYPGDREATAIQAPHRPAAPSIKLTHRNPIDGQTHPPAHYPIAGPLPGI